MEHLPFDKLYYIAGSCLRFKFFHIGESLVAIPTEEGLEEFLERFNSFPSPLSPTFKKEEHGGLGHAGFQFLAYNIAHLGIDPRQSQRELAYRIAGCARVSWADGMLFLYWLIQAGALLNVTTGQESEDRRFLAELLYQNPERSFKGFEAMRRGEELLTPDHEAEITFPAFPQPCSV